MGTDVRSVSYVTCSSFIMGGVKQIGSWIAIKKFQRGDGENAFRCIYALRSSSNLVNMSAARATAIAKCGDGQTTDRSSGGSSRVPLTIASGSPLREGISQGLSPGGVKNVRASSDSWVGETSLLKTRS